MHNLKVVAAAAALLVTPSISLAQDAKLSQKQKAWLASNFQSFDCEVVPRPTLALIGAGAVSFEAKGDSGIDLAVTSGNGGVPTVSAHAINTKGTGAANGRTTTGPCPTTDASSGSSVPVCSVSGDVQLPLARFTVPLAALGASAAGESYVGTVTIVKRASSEDLIGMYLSKKGYDYYQVQNRMGAANPGMLVIARCDSTKLTAKGSKPMTATYDLAVAKK